MRNISPPFKAALTGSHQMVARARLCTPGQQGTNPGPLAPNGEPLYPVAIEDGDVFFDASAQIRGTAQLTTLADWPLSQFDQLYPTGGADLFLERGIAFGDGSREWVSLGYYRLDSIEQKTAPNGPIDIEASDRMATIIDARLTVPRQYLSGATVRAVIEDLVLELFPGITVTLNGFDANAAIGVAQICEQDRYEFLNDIAKSRGCTMFFGYDGSFIMQPVPNYSVISPVWTVNQGKDGVLIKLARKISRDSVFNAVVANGEQVGGDVDPVTAVAYDTNPQSATRWNGPYKQVPRFYSSSFLLTQAQAQQAAQAMLARTTGTPYVIDFASIPNPALEPLDLIAVNYSDRSAQERHIIDKLTIPLVARRAMTGSSRMPPATVTS